MRLGKVKLEFSYVVDLDNTEMVRCAKEFLYEDIDSIIKYGEYDDCIIEEDASLNEHDIDNCIKECVEDIEMNK